MDRKTIKKDKRDEVAENFGKNLQLYLKTRGISQKELADRLGTGTNVVNSWIKGARCPSLSWVYKIRTILDVSYEELLDGPTSESNYKNMIKDRYQTFYKHLFGPDERIILPDNYEELADAVFSLMLKPRERNIIEERFGLNGNMPASYSAISSKQNISRQRVSQIVDHSCNVLRTCKQYLLPKQKGSKESAGLSAELSPELRKEYPYKTSEKTQKAVKYS